FEGDTLKNYSAAANLWSYIRVFENTKQCFDYLDKNHYTSVVTSPHVINVTTTIVEDDNKIENFLLEEVKWNKFKKIAIWFGCETKGISDEAINRSRKCVQIKMFGMVESLNLA